jgi:ankyrin repeat protein
VNAHGSEKDGYTALEAAAKYGRIDMLKLLLNAGADITSDFGRSQLMRALDLATTMGHDAAAKFLKYHQIC